MWLKRRLTSQPASAAAKRSLHEFITCFYSTSDGFESWAKTTDKSVCFSFYSCLRLIFKFLASMSSIKFKVFTTVSWQEPPPVCALKVCSFEARGWNVLHISAICKDSALPPVFCRISPVCSTPFTRWSTPLSTILPEAARLCGSSCPWRLIPASAGGAARRVQQVQLASAPWVAAEREERAFWGPHPLKLPTVSTPRDVFVVMQKGVCFRPVRALFLAVSAALHLSHSIGFNFNDGGSDGATRGAPLP